MKRSSLITRTVGLATAVGVAAAGLVVIGSGSASAAPIGALTFYSGVNDGVWNSQGDTFSFQTDGACPTSPTLSTNFLIRVNGPGLSADVNIQGNTAGSTIGGITSGPFDGPVAQTLQGFATAQAQPGGYLAAGTYTVELVCRQSLQSASLGEFVGQFTVTGSGASSVVSQVVPATPDATTTTLSASSTTPAWGAPVTLTATVANTDEPATKPTGAVQFKDDGEALGSPVPVTAGVATAVVADLDLGANAITAEYVPADADAFEASATSSATAVTVSLGVPTLLRPATLSGSARVGGVVVCASGTWSGATSYRYDILIGGSVAQSSTTDFDRALAPADLGKSLACRVTGINPVGPGAASTTAAVTVAPGTAPTATTKPRIVYSGTPAVGKTFSASKGVWSPSATYTYTYIWKRGTTIVKQGTTATSYRATSLDKGKVITLTVQARRAGYATGTAVSAGVRIA